MEVLSHWHSRKSGYHLTHERFKRMLIYYDTDTQSANYGGNPLCQATKRHLNNSWMVKNNNWTTAWKNVGTTTLTPWVKDKDWNHIIHKFICGLLYCEREKCGYANFVFLFFGGGGGGGGWLDSAKSNAFFVVVVMFYSSFGATYSNIVIVFIIN